MRPKIPHIIFQKASSGHKPSPE